MANKVAKPAGENKKKDKKKEPSLSEKVRAWVKKNWAPARRPEAIKEAIKKNLGKK